MEDKFYGISHAMSAAATHAPGAPTLNAAASESSPATTSAAADWSRVPGGAIDGGEVVILAVKPSMWRPLFESAAWIALCAFLASLQASLGWRLAGLSVTTTSQVLVIIGFGRLGLAIARWISRWYLLTNRRVIDLEGIREPKIWSCPLTEIRNTYLHTSPAERMTSLGTITLVTEHENQPPRRWLSINRPEEVHARLRRAIEQAIDQHDQP